MQRDRRPKRCGNQQWIVWCEESGGWNLEAESIRGRAESTGECVQWKTVTEVRWSSARDTFIAESVHFVLNSLWDWEPVERWKHRSDVVSYTFFQYEASSTVLNATKATDRESRQARRDRAAVVEA